MQPKFDSIEATIVSPRIKLPNKQTRVSVLICAGHYFTVSSMPLSRTDPTDVTIVKGYGMCKGACCKSRLASPLRGRVDVVS